MIRQFRVKFEMETPDNGDNQAPYRVTKADKKKLRTREAAEKRLLLYGPEPWLAFDKGPDDEWCHGKASAEKCGGKIGYGPESPPCEEKHTTAREFWEMKRGEMAIKIVHAWIEERTLSPWSVSEKP